MELVNIEKLEELFLQDLQAFLPTALSINTELATHPELSSQEFKSAELYCKTCEEAGIKVERDFIGLPTAFKAEMVKVSQPKGKLAILCEYDALPEIGHGCGHSASGSLSFLAAMALRAMWQSKDPDISSLITMDVDLIGTPDEEATGCKVDMVNAGVFKEYDYAIMVHLDGKSTRANSRFLALDNFRVKYRGKTAHAAANPWDGINAANGVQLAIHALDMLRQQVRPETRIGTWIITGGQASNMISDFAEFECCVRHTERTYLNEVVKQVKNIFEGVALATGTTVEYDFYGNSYDNMKLNQAGIDLLEQIMGQLNIPYDDKPQTDLGSSDVGNVSFQCPAFHPFLRLAGPDKVAHTIEFAKAMQESTIEKTIVDGASIIGLALLQLMVDPKRMEAIKKDFNQ